MFRSFLYQGITNHISVTSLRSTNIEHVTYYTFENKHDVIGESLNY